MSGVVQTESLRKKFRRVEALRGLDLSVPEGAIYALVGPNGAGKTTAIKILMNLLSPTSGRASVLGMDSRKLSGKAFCSIGYVSENQDLPGWMRAGAFLAYMRPFYPTWETSLEEKLVRQFDVPLDRKLKDLSRGMRMKAALASALAYRPKLIILDEPFSGLDPLVRDELSTALQERAVESTIFLSSHDLAETEAFATHVGYLDGGRLRFSEEMKSLAARFREVELTFDAPQEVPQTLPGTWLHPTTSGTVVRFVDTDFDQARLTAEIRQRLGAVRNATYANMSLRAIFLALAKANQGTS